MRPQGLYYRLRQLVLLTVLIGSTFASAKPVHAGSTYRTAYQIAIFTWDPLPHYGAYFSGTNGTNPGYLGVSNPCQSSSGCMNNWDWNGNRSMMAIPKGNWLWECDIQTPYCRERWQPYKYYAYLN